MVKSKIGKSKFVIAFLVSFVIGIFVGDLLKVDLWWLIGIFIGAIISLIIFWREQYWRLGLIIICGLIIGLGHYRWWDNRQQSINLPIGQRIEFSGQIIGHPNYSSNQASYTLIYNHSKIQITTGRYPEYYYGDILHIKGEIKKPNDYLFHQGILGSIYYPTLVEKNGSGGNIFIKAVYAIRDKFERTLDKILTEPYSSFATGLVLGSQRNIPDSLMSDFQRTGTTHIVAVSGYNLTIVITYIAIFFGIFSRKLKFWGTLLIIIGLVIMTGAPASVVRAGILAGLVVFGRYQGRRINITILIMLVAVLMLLFNPYVLRYDISFQLSFLAFVGLVYLSSTISNSKYIKWLPDVFKSSLSETLAAQIFVLPILIYYFGQLSLVSPLVNVLILWLIPAAMGLIYLVGVLGIIWLDLGRLFGTIVYLVLKYIIMVVENGSRIVWASKELKLEGWWWLVIAYILIGLLIFKVKKRPAEAQGFSGQNEAS